MGYAIYNPGKYAPTDELFVIAKDHKAVWSLGGSSTSPRLMIYATLQAARRGIKFAPVEGCEIIQVTISEGMVEVLA